MAIFFFMALATPTNAYHYSIVTNDSLVFGSFVAGTGGTVTINASNGARSATGGVTLMNSTYRQARFTVSCVPDLILDCLLITGYSIVPVADTVLTNGANSMPVTNFSVYSVNSGNSSGQLSGGTDSLNVGAKLTAGNNQPPGSYSGSFSVTVTYP